MSTFPVVETSGLCRSFADRDAVLDLDLAISHGEIFGLLGPNGAGKTTTIRMLTTLLAPTSGRAWVCGYDVVSGASQVRARIGYVMQQVPARWNMTGREILEIEAALCRVPRRMLRARVEHALTVTGLVRDADRLFQHYSGGMQKRMDIACALVHRPRLLVLDEPTLGLDVQSRHHVWRQVRALRDDGVTVLLATNYLDEADRLCDRLMIIDAGRTIAAGSPEELKRQVGCDVLKVSTDRPVAAMATIRTQGWARRVVIGDGCVHVHVRDASLLLPEVLKVLAAAGAVVTKVTYTRPSLDDVFLMHTGRELLIEQAS
jgi:ABC-2 type transport system ATP-binding protein